MIDTRKVAIAPIEIIEISTVLKKIQPFICASFSDATEGDLRKIALSGHPNLLLKATVESVPFGIIHITKGYSLRIDMWMSNEESPESWIKAIELAIKKAFAFPETGMIEWRITKSSKNMVKIAESCGFKNQGELQGQGLNREPLVSMVLQREKDIQVQKAAPEINTATAAELAEKDKVIKELKFQLEQEKGLAKTFEANLSKKSEELVKATDSKEEDSLKPKNDETETVDNSVQKAKIEIKAPKISVEELEKLIHEAGVSSKTNGMSTIGKVLKCVILNPGIEYKELSKKTDTAQSYVSQNATQLATQGLIVIDRSSYPIKLNPVKDVIKKLQDLAQNRKPEIKPGLNDFDICVLKLILTKPDQGLWHKKIIEKIHEQQQNRSRAAIQNQVSASVKKLAADPLKLVTNDRADGNEKIVKPIMENIRQLPEELQKELGIQEQELQESITKVPVVKSAELVAEIKEPETTVKQQEPESLETKQKESAEKTVQSLTPTPFQIMVQIAKELAASKNGNGIETEALCKIATKKGLTKDEATFAIMGLKREHVLTAWSGSTFLQIDRESLKNMP